MALQLIGNSSMAHPQQGLLSRFGSLLENLQQSPIFRISDNVASDEEPEPAGLLASVTAPVPMVKPKPLTQVEKEYLVFKKDMFPNILTGEGVWQNNQTDTGNYQGFIGSSTEWGKGGKGKLVGTNKGVTAYALSQHLGISPYLITPDMMKGVSDETAARIFYTQYYQKYNVGNIDNAEKRNMAASLAPLRPSVVNIIRKSKDTESAVYPVLLDFKNGVDNLENYRRNILGWTNRVRSLAGLKTLNKGNLFKHYPKLKR